MTTGTATKLAISGMRKVSDAGQIETVLATLPGVYAVRVNLSTHVALVRHEGSVNVSQLIHAIEEAGYRARRAVPGEGSANYASSPWGALRPEGRTPETEMQRYRALAIMGGLLVLLHLGAELWLKGRRDHWAFAHFILATVGQAIIGWQFYVGAWRELMRRRIGPHFLVAAATLTGYFLSASQALFEKPDLHCLSVTVILTVASAGHWLQLALLLRAGRTLRDLVELAPISARVLRGGKEEEILACDLLAGDLAVVRPGKRFPADGTVVEGRSAADESMLTGEALPMPKNPGSQVLGGTINGHGRLVLRVDRVAAETALARMVEMVHDANRSQPKLARSAERVASLLGPGAVLLAIAAFLGSYAGSDGAGRDEGILRAMAVLAAACPWALLIAVPTALSAALGRAARLGILIRSGAVMEACRGLRAVVFDRTGTLTLGSADLTALEVAAGRKETEVLALAAGLAAESSYALDEAICRSALAQGITPIPGEGLSRTRGKGISGRVNGEAALLGSRKFMDEAGVYLGELADAGEEQAAQGHKVMFVAVGGNAAGIFCFEDPLKPGAEHTVDRLQKMGLAVHLMTGDSPAAARTVAAEAGIPSDMIIAEVKPEDRAMKLRAVREKHGPVAMVGDGVADGAALNEANVGIAIGCGTHVDIESADVVLVGQDLRGALRTLRIARRTMRAMRVSIVCSLCFNAVAMPAAALGLLPPVMGLLPAAYGAVAMVLATLLVAANSYQLSLRPGNFPGLHS
jgi:P-type Cu+ transporter